MNKKELAIWLHNNYEEVAKQKKWNTQENCKVEFDNLPDANKKTMIEIAKRLLNFKLLHLNGVSSCDEVRVRQIKTNEFIVEKLAKKTKSKGYLWWKKTEIIYKWQRVNKYGDFINISMVIYGDKSIITYKTLKQAKDWIKNYKKYPIYHYY